MSKLCKETGFLNTEGKEVVQEFSKTIDKLLASPVVNEMSSAEIRTFGSNLAAILADKLSFFLQEKNNIKSKYDSMSDDEFEGYLQNKYGKNILFTIMEPEEMARYQPLFQKKIGEILGGSSKHVTFYHKPGLVFKK